MMGGRRVRNLDGKGLDVRDSHHVCKYCSYAGKYWRNNIQYLLDIKEVILAIKKTAEHSGK